MSVLSQVIETGGAAPAPAPRKPTKKQKAGSASTTAATLAKVEDEAGAGALAKVGDESGALALVLDAPEVGEALDRLHDEGFSGELALMDINGADEQIGGVMPQVKLVQSQTVERMEGLTQDDLGAFVHAVTGEVYPGLTATLIAAKFSRQWLDPFTGEGLQVVCAASAGRERDWEDDRSTRPQDAPPMGQPCATCAHAKWRGREAPECNELYSLLFYMHETREPVVLLVRKSAVKPWRTASQQVKMAGFRAKAQLGQAAWKLPPNLLVRFRVESAKVKGKKGTYYEPRFSGFETVADSDTIRELLQTASVLVPQFADLRAEELDDGTDVFDEAAAANAAAKAAGNGGGNEPGHPYDERNPPPSEVVYDDDLDEF